MEDRTLLSAGDLDPSFGVGGKIFSNFLGPLDSQAQAAVLQPDDKIVVVGSETNDFTYGFGIARFNPDGSLDTTFGTGRTVATSFPGASKNERATAVAIQGDGRIVVAGADTNVELVRYNVDGSLDTSFAGSGLVMTTLSGTPKAIAIQPDQKILVIATTGSGGSFLLSRFNTDGSLDTTFGTGGTVMSSLGSASGVVVEPDGHIIVAAEASLYTGQSNQSFVIAAYNADGSPDTAFGSGGVATSSFAAVSQAILLQPDGKIVVGGMTSGGLAYARYIATGTLDTTFGSGGSVIVSGSENELTGLALQGDGKIVTAGEVIAQSPTSGPYPSSFTLTRLTPTGALDPAFGAQGKVNAQIFTLTTGVYVQTTGRIIIGRTVGDSGASRFALDAFTATGTSDPTFGANGEALAAVIGTTNSYVSSVVLQPDGKIIVASFTAVPASDFLTRYNTDGTLDTTFGNGGRVLVSGVDAVTLQPDGKILVTGSAASPSNGFVSVALWRYNADGSPDLGFGSGGRAIAPPSLAQTVPAGS